MRFLAFVGALTLGVIAGLVILKVVLIAIWIHCFMVQQTYETGYRDGIVASAPPANRVAVPDEQPDSIGELTNVRPCCQ